MKRKAMTNAPKDRQILLLIDDCWIEAGWDNETRADGYKYGDGKWSPVGLPSHGCGCCSYEDPEPTAWSELPT